MTFAAKESSRAAGRPVALYSIRFGPEAGSVLRFTNVGTPITFESNVYQPLAITHSNVTSSGDLDKANVRVTAPENSTLGDLYRSEPPSNVVSIVIYQGHVGDSDFKVGFAGRILSGLFDDNDIECDCEPIVTSMRRVGLTRDYQYSCPLVLYGPGCRANKAAATTTAVVTSVSSAFVTLPSTWAAGGMKDKYIGGIAQWVSTSGRTERRSISGRGGDVLRLSSLAEGLVGGATITLILGCNHQVYDCEFVHNNIQNYGGQPAIPLKNPTGITNNYY